MNKSGIFLLWLPSIPRSHSLSEPQDSPQNSISLKGLVFKNGCHLVWIPSHQVLKKTPLYVIMLLQGKAYSKSPGWEGVESHPRMGRRELNLRTRTLALLSQLVYQRAPKSVWESRTVFLDGDGQGPIPYPWKTLLHSWLLNLGWEIFVWPPLTEIFGNMHKWETGVYIDCMKKQVSY